MCLLHTDTIRRSVSVDEALQLWKNTAMFFFCHVYNRETWAGCKKKNPIHYLIHLFTLLLLLLIINCQEGGCNGVC